MATTALGMKIDKVRLVLERITTLLLLAKHFERDPTAAGVAHKARRSASDDCNGVGVFTKMGCGCVVDGVSPVLSFRKSLFTEISSLFKRSPVNWETWTWSVKVEILDSSKASVVTAFGIFKVDFRRKLVCFDFKNGRNVSAVRYGRVGMKPLFRKLRNDYHWR